VVRILSGGGETAAVALLPFISKGGIVNVEDVWSLEAYEYGQKYAGRVEAILHRLTEDLAPDDVNLVVAHLMGAEGQLGGGERLAYTVDDYAIPATAFGGGLSYVALGHLHRQQRVPAPSPVWYAGSPMQLDFGERGEQKGVLVVEAEPGLPAAVRQVPLTAGTELIQIEGSLDELEARRDDAEIGDAYLKVVVREPARAGLADEIRTLFPNAVDVLLAAPDRPEAAEREVRLGRGPHELFVEYLAHAGVDDERVVALFDELLGAIDET
jgi:exonuclease SbcD